MDISGSNKYFEDVDYALVNNPAVDSVIACISYHNRFNMRIKSIELRHDYYFMFKAYVESKVEVQDGQGFEIDGVEVNLSPVDISNTMNVVFR